jgi:hypothetical protein
MKKLNLQKMAQIMAKVIGIILPPPPTIEINFEIITRRGVMDD